MTMLYILDRPISLAHEPPVQPCRLGINAAGDHLLWNAWVKLDLDAGLVFFAKAIPGSIIYDKNIS